MPLSLFVVGIASVIRAVADKSGACGKWRSGVSEAPGPLRIFGPHSGKTSRIELLKHCVTNHTREFV
jgi:hypothetical protein